MVRVGQRLREARIKKGLSLLDIEKAIKIKSTFISAIEKGEYQKLPQGAYAHGFVRNYADFLGESSKEILALFRREFDEERFFKVLPQGLTGTSEASFRKTRFAKAGFFIFAIFLVLLSYITFQYRFAIINPHLTIFQPKESAVLDAKDVQVWGQTDSNATVYVNNISVSLDKDGVFKKNIDLFPGKTTIVVKAVNRFGKETQEKRHIEVKTP